MPRTRNDYIPRADGTFLAFAVQYYNALEAWWTVQGFDKDALGPLKEAVGDWKTSLNAHVAAQQAAEASRQTKDQSRASLESLIRPLTNFVQAYDKTTDADRAAIGISMRDTPRRAIPAPTTTPIVSVDQPARLTHELKLVDAAAPTRRGKPSGVLGAEVWVKLVGANGQMANVQSGTSGEEAAATGDPASAVGDPATFAYLLLTTKTNVRTTFKPQDGGKTAVYMLRWVNTTGEKGPWSEICSATVAA